MSRLPDEAPNPAGRTPQQHIYPEEVSPISPIKETYEREKEKLDENANAQLGAQLQYKLFEMSAPFSLVPTPKP